MKFETKQPKLVTLLGIALAAGLVIVGATVAPAAMGILNLIAGAALGAVGVQVGPKQ